MDDYRAASTNPSFGMDIGLILMLFHPCDLMDVILEYDETTAALYKSYQTETQSNAVG